MGIKSISLASIAIVLSSNLHAAVIYDNGAPDTQNGYPIADGVYETIDNFNLSSSTNIDSVGFYFQNQSGITGWNQDITYNFYADNAGSVGSLITTGSGQNVIATDSGEPWCCAGGNAWLVEFDLASTLTLGSGNYWMGLTGATGAGREYWVTTDTIDGGFYYSVSSDTYSSTANDFAFYLNGSSVSAVPVPAAVWLFGSGLLGLVGVARRKKA